MLKLFISYSTEDLGFVRQLADALSHRAELMYWQEISMPGAAAWETIFQAINRADLVVAVITDKTVARAMAVGQEIGHAVAKGKTVVPLVAQGISSEDLGCLGGITYIQLASDDLAGMATKIQRSITAKETEISQRKREALIALAVFVGVSLFLPQED